jgi:hypothetical protein
VHYVEPYQFLSNKTLSFSLTKQDLNNSIEGFTDLSILQILNNSSEVTSPLVINFPASIFYWFCASESRLNSASILVRRANEFHGFNAVLILCFDCIRADNVLTYNPEAPASIA